MDDFVPKLSLTKVEQKNPLWLKIEAELKRDLERLRAQNDAPLSEIQTATLRGRIQCLKSIIALGAETPAILADD